MQLVITSWIIFTLSILFQVENSICTYKRTHPRSKNITEKHKLSDTTDQTSGEEYEGVEFKQENYENYNDTSFDYFEGQRKANRKMLFKINKDMQGNKPRKLGKVTVKVFDDKFDDYQRDVSDFEISKDQLSLLKAVIKEEYHHMNRNNKEKRKLKQLVTELLADYIRLRLEYLKENLRNKN